MKTKIAKTNVLDSQMVLAQCGIDSTPANHAYYLWVECPDSYDPAAITAEDILGDNMITVVREPEVGE